MQVRAEFALHLPVYRILQDWKKSMGINDQGSRQHDATRHKRDKFTQVCDTLEEIMKAADIALRDSMFTGAVPLLQISVLESKLERLKTLMEVRRA